MLSVPGEHKGAWAGSHGNSLVVSGGPDGKVLAAAPHTGEHVVVADVAVRGPRGAHSAMGDANAVFARWWRDGVALLGDRMPVD